MTATIRIACPSVCRPDCALRDDGCESRRWSDVRLNHTPPMPVSPCHQAAWASHGIAPWECSECGAVVASKAVVGW